MRLEKISGIESRDKVQYSRFLRLYKNRHQSLTKRRKKIIDHMIFVVVWVACPFILLLAVCVCVCKVLSILYIIFSCNEIDWNEIGSHRFLTQFYRRFLELLERPTIWFLSKNVLLINTWKRICTLHSWFIFDFIVLPLVEIMRKNVRFHWTNVELEWLFGTPNTNWFLDHLYLFDNWMWPFNTMVDGASVGIVYLFMLLLQKKIWKNIYHLFCVWQNN